MKAFVLVLLGKRASVAIIHDIKLTTHNRFYALMLGRFCHELEHTKHIAVVCNGQCFHAIGSSFFEQAGDGCRAVKEGVLGVAV